jgi:alkylation response protein AidB-like acyl-CoA dehydrogenase
VRLRDSDTDAIFREELRAWLTKAVPGFGPAPAGEDWAAKRAYDTAWQRALYDAGYAGIDWPREAGGRGATPTEHMIYLEESAAAGAPDIGVNFVGQLHAGPTLNAQASPEQKAYHLPRILRGESVWCQGFSEPGAGSDLASLRTRAVRDGDHYVVNGSKIWTSYGFAADWCELLVRTDSDAPKHRGITWLIMPMDTPGIEVRPLRTILGVSEFAEMFLDDVHIPVTNRVGAENDGWRVAMVTFSFERGTAFVRELLKAQDLANYLAEVSRTMPYGTGFAADDDGVRRALGRIIAELDALWALTKRNITRGLDGVVPPAGGSSFKLTFADTLHRLGALAMEILGRAGLSLADAPGMPSRLAQAQLHSFAISIGAGTSQIQRNILAERALGLPKER